ncbi:hypothetical protein ZEAMMB73_Zm00001d015536 [Zea mays]|uniref:Uncharacterized protein n=1 Tax=Zea mays TaxID=4577 RepID=A0A1D6H2N6_MAIZE|nr:hypothetical protein ZEAMMB73_Zm00001d015536 [Zea mays]
MFNVGKGINSLSWNSKCKYLLTTCNDVNTVAILKHFSKPSKITCKIIIVPFTKKPHPTTADVFGVFHPTQKSFFIVTNHGAVSVIRNLLDF